MSIITKLKSLLTKPESKLKYIKNDQDFSHLNDREIFKAMYDEVGTIKANKSVVWREEWMSQFDPRPGSAILELGAHNGPNLIYYARLGHMIDGVEISDTLIETFEKHAKLEPSDVQKRMRIFKGWIEDFKPQKKYDYVLVTEVLEHVSDPLLILKKAAQCIGKDGLIYISSPTKHWGNNTHVRGVPMKDLKKWLGESGLKAEKIFEENERVFCYASKQ
ncbi:MAG: class I SAM-dependent methyltransferase [Alphaproteobacteria bacterium]|nr:class I SAM-dependent methyltransferase [Alphaproteobacteria bacterium]